MRSWYGFGRGLQFIIKCRPWEIRDLLEETINLVSEYDDGKLRLMVLKKLLAAVEVGGVCILSLILVTGAESVIAHGRICLTL